MPVCSKASLRVGWGWLVFGSWLYVAPVLAAGQGWVVERDTQSSDQQQSQLSEDQKADMLLRDEAQRALQAYQYQIRQHWPDADVSDATRWVSYSSDWQRKRVVDFAHNRIEITLDTVRVKGRIDFAQQSSRVRDELTSLLQRTLAQGLASDPVYQRLQVVLTRLGAEAVNAPDGLIFSEFFVGRQPTQAQAAAKAQALMRNASVRYHSLASSVVDVSLGSSARMTYVVPLPDDRLRRKVREFAPLVKRQAERFGVAEDVVMAIIHTESHFNPLARSPIPAFGLMQIVPSTAGRDAARMLYKKPKLLSARYLYDPEKNVQVGAAYLNLLYYSYLNEIEHPESRLYYAIAAYNGGLSNVARAFVGRASYQDAVPVINRLSPTDVLQKLLEQSPSLETRAYLEKVLKRRQLYRRV